MVVKLARATKVFFAYADFMCVCSYYTKEEDEWFFVKKRILLCEWSFIIGEPPNYASGGGS